MEVRVSNKFINKPGLLSCISAMFWGDQSNQIFSQQHGLVKIPISEKYNWGGCLNTVILFKKLVLHCISMCLKHQGTDVYTSYRSLHILEIIIIYCIFTLRTLNVYTGRYIFSL